MRKSPEGPERDRKEMGLGMGRRGVAEERGGTVVVLGIWDL